MEQAESTDLANLKPLPREFFKAHVDTVAKALIGAFFFIGDHKGNRTGGMIVETEAYDESDPAAHCHEAIDKRRLSPQQVDAFEGRH
jgi:DNA-3-methyladenine glycosylase